MQPRSTARIAEIDGQRWLIIEMAQFRMSLDETPGSGMYLMVAPPLGGVMGGVSALAKGDQGFSPSLELSSFIQLAHDDPTAASAALTLVVPGTETSAPVYGLDLALKGGAPGAPGAAVVSPGDYAEEPLTGQMLVVASGGTAFELAAQRFGRRYLPAAVSSAPGGTTAGYTMTQIEVGPQGFDWYPEPHGGCIVEGSSSNLLVDVVARLNSDSGDVVGRGYGIAGQKIQLNLTPGANAGSADSVGKVAGDATAVIYFRTEKQSGTATYSASNSTARYWVKVVPA